MKELDLDYEEEKLISQDGVAIETNDLLPILDCPTHWSFTFFFLKRALKLRYPIDEIAKDQDLRKNELQRDEWAILDNVFQFLQNFAIITVRQRTQLPKVINGRTLVQQLLR